MQDRKPPDSALMAPRTRTDIAPIRVEAGATISDMVNRTPGAPRLLTNIDVNSLEGKRMILHSTGNADIDVDKLRGEAVPITFWMVEVATVREEKTDQLVEVPRVVLFQADGQFISFTAWSVARFLDKLMLVMGNGPYYPPVSIAFHRVAGKGGKQSYDCVVVE